MFNTYEMKNSSILKINYDKDKIDTDPIYQRRSDIWNLEKRQLFIDSILNDFDIPKLYLYAYSQPIISADGKKRYYAIIDGKQRLETIWNFMLNEFPLADDFIYYLDEKVDAKGMYYDDLSITYPSLKVVFDSYTLPIVIVETSDTELIEEMFSRLNEAVPLNSAEKRNAIGGPMARIIREIADYDFFQKVKFTNFRFQHREVTARLLFLEYTLSNERKIIDTKKPYLDDFVKKFKFKPDSIAEKLGEDVKNILRYMKEIFNEKDDLLSSQAIVPIYYLLFKYAIIQNRVMNITKEKLIEFNDMVSANRIIAETDLSKADFELLEYSRLTIQGTNDASGIRERVRIICNRFGISYTLPK
jgi:hypothetical protein